MHRLHVPDMASRPEEQVPSLRWRRIVLALKPTNWTSTAMAIVLVLQSHMDDSGEAFPSHRTIAEEALTTEETVSRWLKRIVEQGWLRRRKRPSPSHGYVYQAALPPDFAHLMGLPSVDLKSMLREGQLMPDQPVVDEATAAGLSADQQNSPDNSSQNSLEHVDTGSSEQTDEAGRLSTEKIVQLEERLDPNDPDVADLVSRSGQAITRYDILAWPPDVRTRLIARYCDGPTGNGDQGHQGQDESEIAPPPAGDRKHGSESMDSNGMRGITKMTP